MKKKFILSLIFILSFAIFYPSLFVFFTNDDFFFLKISNIHSLGQFFNFFAVSKGPAGFPMYRPLATQAFYYISHLFNLSPVPLHILSFIVFFGVIYLIYLLAKELSGNEKIAYISAFLYGLSATHFAHLYYLATFQELGMTLFVFLSVIFFLRKRYWLALIGFILALMCKETAVVAPFLIAIVYFYKEKKVSKYLTPFIICLFAYLFIRFCWYGFASGDTYIWDFSLKKLFNTLVWYGVWSLNIPETLVDFIGPGLKINPNLFLYWTREVMPILIGFAVLLLEIGYLVGRSIFRKGKELMKENNAVSGFSGLWFLVSLLPVVFLPFHKFPFYLTLPLFGVVFRLSYLLSKVNKSSIFIGIFLFTWTVLSILTVKHTVATNWVTNGEEISRRAYDYFSKNEETLKNSDAISLIDTPEDANLPYNPISIVKVALSDKNFFYVYFPNLADKIDYGGQNGTEIKARQFLGY